MYTFDQVKKLSSVIATATVCISQKFSPAEVAIVALTKMKEEELPIELAPIVLGIIGKVSELGDVLPETSQE